MRIEPVGPFLWLTLPGQSLAALLALVGTKRMDVEALRNKTKLSTHAFVDLLNWLQQEYLVDVIASRGVDGADERITLTEKGEKLLVSILERTCELPEFR